MKIIDNIKDYYDYIAGVKGIDNYVVFDRRKSIPIGNHYSYRDYFDSTPNYDENFRIKNYNKEKLPYLYLSVVLEVGYIHYFFSIKRNGVDFEVKLERKFEENKHFRKTPLTLFYTTDWRYRFNRGNILDNIENISISEILYNSIHNNRYEDLPILRDTWIPKFIPADEIFDNIYNFILREKEPKIIDNRSDKLKLESAGFDNKTSFRNPIK